MDNGFNNGYYRLGDIGKLYYSKKWVSHNNGLFPIYGTGGIISLTNKPTFEPNSIILPRVGTLKIYFSSFKHSTKNTAFSYKTKNPKLTKYIYYKLHKIDFLHQNEGSAVP
ncbi:MAG: type I restriction endonuclease subunit S, partial [Mycoplasma sp.]|nr:type I restriction endonuclease subunit S [Mycoplasma sp.]